MGLRLMLYDRTCTHTAIRGWRAPLGLSHSWQVGGPLYGALSRLDRWRGVASWAEGLEWLATADEPIDEIQFWGHGRRGTALVDREGLSVASLAPGHPHARALDAVRERMHPGSRWWFRTCDTFGGDAGHTFARRWTDHFGCDAAGFTYVIGVWQSGLHRLSPGAVPRWPASEGIAVGTPAKPVRSAGSAPWRPHTITCFDGSIPAGW